MTNFILIDPTNRTVQNYNAPTYKDALAAVGLDIGEVDHATIGITPSYSISIWVYEYGLLAPKTQCYFILNNSLYNGPAVLYTADPSGETVDCHPDLATHIQKAHIIWLSGTDEVEAAIASGKTSRPQSSVNGTVCWEWNKPTHQERAH